MRRAVLAVALLFPIACGGGGGGRSSTCEPGEPVPCACGDLPGTAACEDGGRPGACVCPEAVTWLPSTIDFGELAPAMGVEAIVSLRNDSDTPVPIRSVSLAPGTSAEFAIVSAPSVVRPAGEVASIVVRFRSAVPVDAAGTLLVALEGGADAIAVPLRAVVVGPALSCTPATLDFGRPTLGVRTTLPVQCTNTGVSGIVEDALLRPREVVSDDPEFSGTAPVTELYGPGETFTFDVRYVPADDEADASTVRLVTDRGLEVPIAVVGTSATERCDLEAVAVALTGVPGEDLAGEVAIHNRREDAACLVDRLEADPACTAGFSFDLPAPRTAIAPGGTLRVPVGFRADEQAVYGCSLRVIADDPEGHEWVVPLEATLSWRPCLALEGPTELAPISPSCGPSRIEPALVNRCNREFFVDGLRFIDFYSQDDRPAAGFAAAIDVPASIPPRGWLALPVIYDPDPDDEGARSVSATLEVRSRLDADPWRFGLAAERTDDDLRTRYSHQAGGGLLDILVVIDNGVGMAAEMGRVIAALGSAPERLAGWDYRLAVTTTGVTPTTSGTCPGGVGGGEDGRFVPVDGSRPRVIAPDTPDARAAWEANLAAVGACSDQPAQPLAAAWTGLVYLKNVWDDSRHPEEDDGNAGLLRPSQPLLLLLVGNRDDASPETPDYYFSWIEGTRSAGSFDVATIAGPPGTGCTGPDGVSAAPGDRLHQFASRVGGTEYSICDASWGVFDRFEMSVIGKPCFPAGTEADDRNADGVVDEYDLEVRVGDTPLPPADPDGHRRWSWDRASGQVCFAADSLPAPGFGVSVTTLECG
jgi:hypothetical protein